MITIRPSEQLQIAAEANQAPSVHNTQPARWIFREDEIEICADGTRFLSVGDPSLRDAGLSCGAAAEGTRIALARRGIGVADIDDVWSSDTYTHDRFRRAAILKLAGGTDADPLSEWVSRRFTWRDKFAPLSQEQRAQLSDWAERSDAVRLVTKPGNIKWIADLNDRTSLAFFRDRAYRDELTDWMRFSKSDPRWRHDGLSADAMSLSRFEAMAAKFALSSPWFEIANSLGLSGVMVSERAKTVSASAVWFFHVEAGEGAIQIGCQFYRMWLELSALGIVCWPMAVLADNPHSNSECVARFDLPNDRRLVNVFRLGSVPPGAPRPEIARLPAEELVLNLE